MLGSLGVAIVLREVAGPGSQVPVLAAFLALSLSRVTHDSAHERLTAAAEVPVVTLAAAGPGGW